MLWQKPKPTKFKQKKRAFRNQILLILALIRISGHNEINILSGRVYLTILYL